ncbi:hypothetical protein P2318_32920 [Myxococcaceae bacterium GXIMD 01537]
MAEEDSLNAKLRALRHAADRGDWNACSEATEALLPHLPMARALELTRAQVERRLPAFERHQPGVTWPRAFLEALRAPEDSGDEERGWPPGEDEFPGPGANTFIRALDALRRARRPTTHEAQRVTALVEAIQSAILAEKTEAWGARHPDRWAFWYENALSDEPGVEQARTQVLLDMARDPESVRLKRAGWRDVADRLAEAMGPRLEAG